MISIILPVYNAESYLCRCIDSILSQSYTNFELLIIDDGSTDGSGTICDEYAAKDSRIRVFHKQNGGVSSARNLGLDNARGEFITFCDADDYVNEEWLAAYRDAITERVDLAIQGFHMIDGDRIVEKKITVYQGNTIEEKRTLITLLMCQGVYGYLWVKLFRRQLIEKFAVRFDMNSAFCEDEQFLSHYLLYAKKIICINSENYYYMFPSVDRTYYTSHSIGYTSCQILLFLNQIYNNEIPPSILERKYIYVKDYLSNSIANNTILKSSEIKLYKSMIAQLGYTDNYKHKILNFLICKNHRIPTLSKMLLRIIRCIGQIRG